MHLILTGATGLVGSAVLDTMLKTKEITKISILSRREVPMATAAADPRVNIINHTDFSNYADSNLLPQLQGATGCVWALGISQNSVTADEYVKITKDYALKAAEAFVQLGTPETPFRFVYVSGEGAAHKPGMFTQLFGRVKGETEMALGDLSEKSGGKLRADSVRPGAVDAQGHEAIAPFLQKREWWYSPTIAVMRPGLKMLAKSFHSPTLEMGTFMTRMAMGQVDGRLEGSGAFRYGPSWVVPNAAIRKMMQTPF